MHAGRPRRARVCVANMASHSPRQLKGKTKRKSKLIESPSISKHQDHCQWVYLPNTTQWLIPSNKVNAFQQLEQEVNLTLLAEKDLLKSLPGGVMVQERGVVYANWTHLNKLDISEHLPVKADSILLNPETMKGCGIAIASPVLVKSFGRSVGNNGEGNKYICSKAWPLPSLPLDVVALGWSAVLGCCEGEEGEEELRDGVQLSPLRCPVSRVPVAGEVTLVPNGPMPFSVDNTFTSYILHMHDGCLVTPFSYLGVQYFGERRIFKVVGLQPLLSNGSRSALNGDSSSTSSVREMEQKLSRLDLNGSVLLEEDEDNLVICKITARTRLNIMNDTNTDTQRKHLPTLSEVGGAKKQVEILKEVILRPLSAGNKDGVRFPNGVILHGPSGVGKSLLAKALAGHTTAHSIILSATQLLTQNSEDMLQRAFSEARNNCPCLIILDDLDDLCPHQDASPNELERKTMASISAQLDDLHRHPPPAHVVVLATTNQIERVEANLRRPGRFDKEVELPVPSASDRLEILEIQLHERFHNLSQENVKCIAEKAHGYVGADLLALCSEAQFSALHRKLEGVALKGESEKNVNERVKIEFDDMLSALREVRPSAMREVTLEVPKVLWSDIGGQAEVKQGMQEAVEWPLTHPKVFVSLGIKPPRGVLLYGPPGCSKTMVAQALATESGLNFMTVKGPELLSKWVGDSERAVRQVFRRARAAAPAIIFFDEIDALAVQRKNDGSSVADRVLAQLLTEMDGVENLDNVLVVAATNRPDMIDKALLRPGRIDRLIYVPLPSEVTRREIFEIQFRKIPINEDVLVEELVSSTHGFSGAEIVSLCQKAALCAMHEDMKNCCVSWRHFEEALKTISPQTDKTTLKFYEEFKNK